MDTNWLYLLLQRNSADPLLRLKLGNEILVEVSERKILPHPKLINDFLDVLTQWLSGSNFKVSIIGLEILDSALRTSPEILASYYFDRLAILIERMGDSKPNVRELSFNLLLRLAYLENCSPVMLLDRLSIPGTGFDHKQPLVKVGSLNILKEFLASSFAIIIQQSISLIPQMCKLMSDPNSEVRDASTSCITDLMVYGGPTIISRISKLVSEQKMTALLKRHNQIVATRGDLPSPTHPTIAAVLETPSNSRNSLLRRSLRSPAKIYTTPNATHHSPFRIATPPTTPTQATSRIARDMTRSSFKASNAGNLPLSISRMRSSSCTPSAICAVSQDDFRKAFHAVPKTTIFSSQDIREKLETARRVLSNPNEDWSKRSNQLKLIRSIITNSEDIRMNHQDLTHHLNELADCLAISVRDLRSQVVREACITCSFLLDTYGIEMRPIGESVFGAALSQVAVSTKIMASSAAALSMFVVERCATRHIFSHLLEFSQSRAKEQRRQVAILIEIVIAKWDERIKTPLIAQIAQIVRGAICDADFETRSKGRSAFSKLEHLHPEIAEQIFRELDSSKQKMLRDGIVSSSSSSLNSDRENNNTKHVPNISQKFLAQRSSSAVDVKQIVAPKPRSVNVTPSKLPRVNSSVRSSGYGQTRSKTPLSPTSQDSQALSKSSSSSSIQTPIQRVASNLGTTSFVASLTEEQASTLQSVMDKARDEMNKQQNNEDDEFLLSEAAKTPPRQIPTRVAEIATVEHVLKACASSSSNEKKDSIKVLASIITDLTLSDSEVKQIGDTLTRLLAEGNTTLLIQILDTITSFVKLYHGKLSAWLKTHLGKLFAKLGSDNLPNIRAALISTQKTILHSFDPLIQLKCVSEFMCDPIYLLPPRGRNALLEYLCLLFQDVWPEHSRNYSIDSTYTRMAINKMFRWMYDQPILMESCERLICTMFNLNAADFTTIFNELPQESRDWSYRILQLNGQQQQQQQEKLIETESPVANNNYKPSDCPPMETNSRIKTYEAQKSIHFSGNLEAQSNYIDNQLTEMRQFHEPKRINEAMANIHGMMCEGTFTLWNEFFDSLLDNIYQILSLMSPEVRKKLALRILSKMCTAQASKLFDSTEIAISKVLHTACQSTNDSTMGVTAEDCLRTLATHLPLPRILHVSQRIMSQDDETRSAMVLKMLTRMFQQIDEEELMLILRQVAPSFVHAYESPSSLVRKCAVYGLVALIQRVGINNMDEYLKSLNVSKRNLIDLYIERATKSSDSTVAF